MNWLTNVLFQIKFLWWFLVEKQNWQIPKADRLYSIQQKAEFNFKAVFSKIFSNSSPLRKVSLISLTFISVLRKKRFDHTNCWSWACSRIKRKTSKPSSEGFNSRFEFCKLLWWNWLEPNSVFLSRYVWTIFQVLLLFSKP